ncbi:hypothetical protein DFH11DRAFT_1723461 [Phellopilus nigrolimitatus]|nr:hypothetical protein DFH11DRAFT_1723461 [Phellopilus nigrolimitatus]
MDQIAAAKVGERVAQGGVLAKLIFFAVSLAVVPLSTYFGTQKFVWNGNSTYAAISAVFAANVVLVAYIAQSIYEDKTASVSVGKEVKVEETRKER